MSHAMFGVVWVAMSAMVSCLTAPDVSEPGKYACSTSADCALDMACQEQTPGVFRCVDATYREDALANLDFPDCWEVFNCDHRGLFSVPLTAQGSASVWGQIDGNSESHNYLGLVGGPDRDVLLITPPAGRMVDILVRPGRADSGLNPSLTLTRSDGRVLRMSGYGESSEVRLRYAAPGGFDAFAGLVLIVEEGDNLAGYDSGFGWVNPEGGEFHDYVVEVTTEPLPVVDLGALATASPLLSTYGELSAPGDIRYYTFCASQEQSFTVSVSVEQPDIQFAVEPLDSRENQLRHRSFDNFTAPATAVLENSDFEGGTACDDPGQNSMMLAVYEVAYKARLWTFAINVSLDD